MLRQDVIAKANIKPSNFQNVLSSNQATLSQLQYKYDVTILHGDVVLLK